MECEPIGVFCCNAIHPQDAPRQAVLAEGNTGVVHLHPGRDYEQALRDLDGFSRIWLVFHFHKNRDWKPMVQPPRANRKVGVFASRAPYRPNAIGLSCVELLEVRGLEVRVANHDLLDGTPILDIKPYVPYADSFPDTDIGWLGEATGRGYGVEFGDDVRERLAWLADHGVPGVEGFLREQLSFDPTDGAKKRVRAWGDGVWEIAYRTWRARFGVDESGKTVHVVSIRSGYSDVERADGSDPYLDKTRHDAFVERFGGVDADS